jgi:6,7-dimethyl-8-ribityllumazine synthase
MANILKGKLDGTGLRVGIVVSRFNSTVTDRLLDGALKALREKGVAEDDITVIHVPGAFEIPFFAARLVDGGDLDAVITLGAIVRGETQHHEYLGHSVCQQIARLSVESETPLTMGILTTENMEQALRRSGDDPGNKGYESALGAIEIATLRAALG